MHNNTIFIQRGGWLGAALLLFVLIDTWSLGGFYISLTGQVLNWSLAPFYGLILAVHMVAVALPALGKEYESETFAWIIGIMNVFSCGDQLGFSVSGWDWGELLVKGAAASVWGVFIGYAYSQLPQAFTQALRAKGQTVQGEIFPIVAEESPSLTPAQEKYPEKPAWVEGRIWASVVKEYADCPAIWAMAGKSEQQCKDRRKYLRRKAGEGAADGEERCEVAILNLIL